MRPFTSVRESSKPDFFAVAEMAFERHVSGLNAHQEAAERAVPTAVTATIDPRLTRCRAR